MKSQRFLYIGFILIFMVFSLSIFNTVFAAPLYKNTKGNITWLAAVALGSGYGPGHDFIDTEIIIKLDNMPGMAFGFYLRDNNNDTAVRQAMFEILLEAYKNNWPVYIDYKFDEKKNNFLIHRVWVSK
jgi:hypothetical protein